MGQLHSQSTVSCNSPVTVLSLTTHTTTSAMSAVKQNFHLESEAWINKQINMELYASYVYLSMSAYFARDDIALHGFAKRFRANSTEEKEHAEKLIDYQIMRGGRAGLSRAGEDCQRVSPRHAQSGGWARGRADDGLPGGNLPQGAGGGHQGDRRPDHQDEEGRGRPGPAHHRQGAPVKSYLLIRVSDWHRHVTK